MTSPVDSCDTFVVLPSVTKGGCIIFGKNSDRPRGEVQEIVYKEAADHPEKCDVQCTYISIPQAKHTYAVILSKPAWMWGAEMGANELGVCIGNEAVWNKALNSDDRTEKLLGMDLVRLALERSSSAKLAVELIGELLEAYGQGGRCFEDPDWADIIYHNSFLLADSVEAWVMETAGKHWAAEKVSGNYRNISNQLSIGTQIDLKSSGLEDFARENEYWNGTDTFDFTKVFSKPAPVDPSHKESPANRFTCGQKLLETLSANKNFDVKAMFSVLRDKDSGICRTGTGPGKSTSTGSQVSVIPPHATGKPAVHWLTGTPNPSASVFKPFIFVDGIIHSKHVVSPDFGPADPVRVKPRFGSQVDRRHDLLKAHEAVCPLPGNNINTEVWSLLREVENSCVKDVDEFFEQFDAVRKDELKDLFKDCVESEMKFYRTY